MTDYVQTMAYAGDHPWWSQDGKDPRGVQLAGLATADEMLKASGQDWDVLQKPVEVNLGTDENPKYVQFPGQVVNYRSDNLNPLGIVKLPYTIIPNSAMYDLLRPVTDKAIYETAGVLKGGEMVWVLAKVGEFQVVNKDWVRDYVVVINTHNGSLPLVAGHCQTRVVCWNTAAMALDELARGEDGNLPVVRIKHLSNYAENLKLAHKVLGLATKNSEKMAEIFRSLAAKSVGMDLLYKFVHFLFPSKPEDDGKRANKITQDHRDFVYTRFDEIVNNFPGAEHTGWSLYNCATEFADWSAPKKGTDKQYRSWFGGGADIRTRSLRWLVKNLLGKEL